MGESNEQTPIFKNEFGDVVSFSPVFITSFSRIKHSFF